MPVPNLFGSCFLKPKNFQAVGSVGDIDQITHHLKAVGPAAVEEGPDFDRMGRIPDIDGLHAQLPVDGEDKIINQPHTDNISSAVKCAEQAG